MTIIGEQQTEGATNFQRPPETTTHSVHNQPSEFGQFNWFTSDAVLRESVSREGAAWAEDRLARLGANVGGEPREWGRQANENPPVLHTHDRFGNKVNRVEFHPSYHRLMTLSLEAGIGGSPWREPQSGAHVARAAAAMLTGQVDAGHICPVSGTYASVAALRHQPDLAATWEPLLSAPHYDPSDISPWQKTSVTCAMGMTEKQGGSDVRANTTTATPIGSGGPGQEYLLRGHKWFFSAPMCDLGLFLAQTPEGLSCFLMPRRLPDGEINNFRLIRLKDKLGNRSNASSEIEFDGAWAQLVGEPGRGVATIIEMVNHTRLDCLVGSAAGMRYGVARAIHHASERSAFGALLVDQPLMQNVLADLAVESEAATILAMRIAGSFDRAQDSEHEAHIKRLGTAVSKYWVCKRLPRHSYEVLEAHGGNGFITESGIPRLYQEAPLMSVWEGTGNVMCLDVLRAMAKEPASLEAFFVEVERVRGSDHRLDAMIDATKAELSSFDDIQLRARRIVEMMALTLQAALTIQHADPAVADAYLASRLEQAGHEYGTLPTGLAHRAIIDRHSPHAFDSSVSLP